MEKYYGYGISLDRMKWNPEKVDLETGYLIDKEYPNSYEVNELFLDYNGPLIYDTVLNNLFFRTDVVFNNETQEYLLLVLSPTKEEVLLQMMDTEEICHFILLFYDVYRDYLDRKEIIQNIKQKIEYYEVNRL